VTIEQTYDATKQRLFRSPRMVKCYGRWPIAMRPKLSEMEQLELLADRLAGRPIGYALLVRPVKDPLPSKP